MELPDLSVTAWLAGAVVCLLMWVTSRRPRDLPPGPALCLPLVGHLPLMRGDPRQVFRAMRQRYGDVFHLYLGSKLVVVLNGYDVIKEALVKHGDVLSNRPDCFAVNVQRRGTGILASNGTTWKEQRNFVLRALRDFGFGKSHMQDKIMEEVTYLIAAFKDENEAFDPHDKLVTAISNIICNMIFGKRFEYDDPHFLSYNAAAQKNLAIATKTELIESFPFLKYVPGDLFNHKEAIENVRFIESDFLWPRVREHLKNYDPSKPNEDLIDAYIREMKRIEAMDKPTSINMENLNTVVGDIFVAGTDTTATVLRWMLLILLNYPHIQERLFQEIKDKVGLARAARLEDKAEMPYVEAFIMEVLRFMDILPFSGPRAASKEVVVKGHRLPPDTTIIVNLNSVLHDPALWDKPEEFRPERFLQDGRLVKREEFVPFCLGRRMCPGESVAWMEIFLFTVTFIQHFRFVCETGSSPPKMEGVLGLAFLPNHFKLKAIPRF